MSKWVITCVSCRSESISWDRTERCRVCGSHRVITEEVKEDFELKKQTKLMTAHEVRVRQGDLHRETTEETLSIIAVHIEKAINTNDQYIEIGGKMLSKIDNVVKKRLQDAGYRVELRASGYNEQTYRISWERGDNE